MALDPLATAGDLTARNITVPSGMNADTLLASASAEVRDAAGCAISQLTSTIELVLDDWTCEIELPAPPVTAVSALSIDGAVISQSTLTSGVWSAGWRRVGDSILLNRVDYCPPATATVTYTHGLPNVPEDIVDLVCGMVSIAAAADGDYGSAGRLKSVRLGDYSEATDTPPGTESPSPFTLPDRTREQLRARFGNSVGTSRMN